MSIVQLPAHLCPECLSALNGFREWPQSPRRSFFRAQCDKCGWTGPKTMSSSSVEYFTHLHCPFCNKYASSQLELREHILGCEDAKVIIASELTAERERRALMEEVVNLVQQDRFIEATFAALKYRQRFLKGDDHG